MTVFCRLCQCLFYLRVSTESQANERISSNVRLIWRTISLLLLYGLLQEIEREIEKARIEQEEKLKKQEEAEAREKKERQEKKEKLRKEREMEARERKESEDRQKRLTKQKNSEIRKQRKEANVSFFFCFRV